MPACGKDQSSAIANTMFGLPPRAGLCAKPGGTKPTSNVAMPRMQWTTRTRMFTSRPIGLEIKLIDVRLGEFNRLAEDNFASANLDVADAPAADRLGAR